MSFSVFKLILATSLLLHQFLLKHRENSYFWVRYPWLTLPRTHPLRFQIIMIMLRRQLTSLLNVSVVFTLLILKLSIWARFASASFSEVFLLRGFVSSVLCKTRRIRCMMGRRLVQGTSSELLRSHSHRRQSGKILHAIHHLIACKYNMFRRILPPNHLSLQSLIR